MKKIAIIIICAFAAVTSFAQVFKTVSIDNQFADSLNKVVLDFKNNFRNIQSQHLPVEINADAYQSIICLPGASHCTILRYHSEEDNSASWQATMYTGDSYNEAVKNYKKVFSQIKKTSIKGIESAPTKFKGDIESIDENVRFTVSSLRLSTSDIMFKNFVADIELTNTYFGWEVHLNLYSKKLSADLND